MFVRIVARPAVTSIAILTASALTLSSCATADTRTKDHTLCICSHHQDETDLPVNILCSSDMICMFADVVANPAITSIAILIALALVLSPYVLVLGGIFLVFSAVSLPGPLKRILPAPVVEVSFSPFHCACTGLNIHLFQMKSVLLPLTVWHCVGQSKDAGQSRALGAVGFMFTRVREICCVKHAHTSLVHTSGCALQQRRPCKQR